MLNGQWTKDSKMFNNILVITDNIKLFRRFYEILGRKKLTDSHFSFAVTPYSNKEDFQITPTIDILKLNVKRKEDIEFITTNFDLVLSVHCHQIFPPSLINKIRCINIHPGFNPVNRGWYSQVFSIIHKLDVGATIHEIDDQVDHGGIIAREFVKKESFDTSKTLYEKIVDKEMELVDAWLEKIIQDDYVVSVPEEEGTLFLKRDFMSLLELDLNETSSLGHCIDKLRALTFEGYDNAYFIDPDTGKKVFVEIKLRPQ
jgi:methionyl-tRNA formyltransferase